MERDSERVTPPEIRDVLGSAVSPSSVRNCTSPKTIPVGWARIFVVDKATLICDDSPMSVRMDIKPSSLPNSINVKSKGVIPVAIISTTDFDASSVAASSLAFGPGGAPAVHGGHLEDVSGDGLLDLMLHFGNQETGIDCGDTSAVLTGRTFDGQRITGEDSVRTVPCK